MSDTTTQHTPAASEDVRDEIARILCEVAQEAHDDAPHVGPGPMYVPSDFGGHADRIIALLRTPRGEGEAEQGPRAAPLHRYVGQRSPEGYAVCEDCGARENTPEAARPCPATTRSESDGE